MGNSFTCQILPLVLCPCSLPPFQPPLWLFLTCVLHWSLQAILVMPHCICICCAFRLKCSCLPGDQPIYIQLVHPLLCGGASPNPPSPLSNQSRRPLSLLFSSYLSYSPVTLRVWHSLSLEPYLVLLCILELSRVPRMQWVLCLLNEWCFCQMTTFLFGSTDQVLPVGIITVPLLWSILLGESFSF